MRGCLTNLFPMPFVINTPQVIIIRVFNDRHHYLACSDDVFLPLNKTMKKKQTLRPVGMLPIVCFCTRYFSGDKKQ
jgi:hypothetical protein